MKLSRNAQAGHRRQRGFTLIELVVVCGIGIVLTAMAIPVITTTMDDYKLRGNMVNAAALAQRARMVAIQQDNTQRLHFSTVNTQVVLYVENSANTPTKPANTDQQTWLPQQFSIPGAPQGGNPPVMTSLAMWGSTVTLNTNVDAYFNSRGLPCLPNPNVCNLASGFVYYFKYQGRGATRWAAISISPAGRIESWFWNGASWGN